MFRWLKDLFKTDRELEEEWIKSPLTEGKMRGMCKASVPMKPAPPPPLPQTAKLYVREHDGKLYTTPTDIVNSVNGRKAIEDSKKLYIKLYIDLEDE